MDTPTQVPPPQPELNCNPTSPTPFEQVLTDFKKTLDPLLDTAYTTKTSKSKLATTARDSVCSTRAINHYLLEELKEYILFNNCITISVTKDAEEFVSTAKSILEKGKSFNTAYTTAVNTLKTAKQKIEQVKILSDKLTADVPNSCNSEERKQIIASMPSGGYAKSLEASVAEIAKYALKITNNTDNASEAAVKIAIINSFINVQSLNDASANIKKGADEFVSDVDANLKSIQGDYETSRKNLGDAQKLSSTASLEKYKAIAVHRGLEWTKKLVVDDPACQKLGGCKRLDELVTEAEESFDPKVAETPAEYTEDK